MSFIKRAVGFERVGRFAADKEKAVGTFIVNIVVCNVNIIPIAVVHINAVPHMSAVVKRYARDFEVVAKELEGFCIALARGKPVAKRAGNIVSAVVHFV